MDTSLASWRKTQALYARKCPPRLVWREMDFHAFVCSLVFVSKNQQTARPLLSGVSVLVPPGAVTRQHTPLHPHSLSGSQNLRLVIEELGGGVGGRGRSKQASEEERETGNKE
ncbi:hypothetical protein Pmani_003983 [Petrolisthes manimaculis]|uniref:Uncharacterized protein n=1 Tax=Petrolisthes manimaculis TaxID=1843537 RepID=A0AAE1QHR2_9EUCA|nr:hypothetical protein Pmani_003983 [Petrolisthes manimaculis]